MKTLENNESVQDNWDYKVIYGPHLVMYGERKIKVKNIENLFNKIVWRKCPQSQARCRHLYIINKQTNK